MKESSSRFVAVANGVYATLPALTRAVDDSCELADLLKKQHEFLPVVLPNLERGPLLDAMEQYLGSGTLSEGCLIVCWIGHGKIGDDGTLRLLGYSGARDVELAGAGQLGEWAARTGARQVLVLIDTCYSGGGLVEAVRVATAVNNGRASPGTTWFCVLAASLADEPSRSGVLVRELQRLLSQGPRNPDFRWDKTRPYICGYDLVQALLTDWTEPRHTPFQISAGRAWDLVRNPLHQAGVPDQPVEHLLLAARGSSGAVSFFTGRERPLRKIVAWIRRNAPSLFVVTGPPGCGKSAIAGRIVSLSSSTERASLQKLTPIDDDLDPGAGTVDAQLHARGATVDTASEALAQQLGLAAGGGQFAILAEARRRRRAGDPMVIVIDGLDEARGFSGDLAIELVVPLAREALVLVTTRDVPKTETTLVKLLGPAADIVDFAEDVAGTRQDVRDYVIRRLDGVSALMDPVLVAHEVIGPEDSPSAAPFLLARLVTSQLREHPVDTSSRGWQLHLANTVESALEVDLQSVALEVAGKPHPTAAREMMHALARAHGAGFPVDDVWPAVATAISWSGTNYSRDDAYAVLGALGRHIVASYESGQPVYRIAHQRMVDYLVANTSFAVESRGIESVLAAVGTAVSQLYEELLDVGLRPSEHVYLWNHAWRHLAEAGATGLESLRRLAQRNRSAFLPDLAGGLELAAWRAWNSGSGSEALRLFEEAVANRRELGSRLKLVMSLFSVALVRTGVGDDEGAATAAREASSVARDIHDEPAGRMVLSAALVARSLTLAREGRYKAARLLAEEVIALSESGNFEDADPLLPGLAAAYVVVGQASLAENDLDTAERFYRRAVDLVDERIGIETGRDVLGDALASLSVVEFLRAFSAVPESTGTFLPTITTAGDRLLNEHRQARRPRGIGDISTARGLQFLVRVRVLDAARGVALPDLNVIPDLLDESIELLRPFAEQVADAAVLLATGLTLRAFRRSDTDPRSASDDLANAERILRRFPGQSALIAYELGEVIDASVALALALPMQDSGVGMNDIINRESEAVALLRRGTALLQRLTLAKALSRLALLRAQAGGSEDLEAATRAEAIDVWRSLVGVVPDAIGQLAGQLCDQSAQLMARRPVEALDCAREALDLANQLPQPQFAALTGVIEVNLAAIQMTRGDNSDNRELLQHAIGRLEPFSETPTLAGALANAYANLALVEIGASKFAESLRLAERAIAVYSTPGLPLGLSKNRSFAYLAIGRSQRGLGQFELGTATLRAAIDELRIDLVSGRAEVGVLAHAVNVYAEDLWDEVLEALHQRPDLVRMLRMLQRRSSRDAHVTVQTLVDALSMATTMEVRTIRAIARLQRSTHRDAFDAAWRHLMGQLPAWLEMDPTHDALVVAWWNAPTWALSRDYLQSHTTLLNPATDIVLEEFRLDGLRADLVNRHLQLLGVARIEGIEAAYSPLLAEIDSRDWMGSDDPEEHLSEHTELLRPDVSAALRRLAVNGDQKANAFVAILELEQRNERGLAFRALKDPNSALDHLQSAWRSKDISRLRSLATIMQSAAEPSVRRKAIVAGAVASLLESRGDDAERLFALAVDDSTGGDDVDELIAIASDAITQHPSIGADIERLIRTLTDRGSIANASGEIPPTNRLDDG